MVEIDKGVPITERMAPGAVSRQYPINQLEVGDSFAVPDRKHLHLVRKICNAKKWYVGRRTGWNYTSRLLPDGTGRVWRLPDTEPDV